MRSDDAAHAEIHEATLDFSAVDDSPKQLVAAPGLDLLAGGDALTPARVREVLHAVIDPELGIDIVELGLLRDVVLRDGDARITFTVTTPACPLSSYIEDEIRANMWQIPGVRSVDVEVVYEPPWTPEDMSELARENLGFEL